MRIRRLDCITILMFLEAAFNVLLRPPLWRLPSQLPFQLPSQLPSNAMSLTPSLSKLGQILSPLAMQLAEAHYLGWPLGTTVKKRGSGLASGISASLGGRPSDFWTAPRLSGLSWDPGDRDAGANWSPCASCTYLATGIDPGLIVVNINRQQKLKIELAENRVTVQPSCTSLQTFLRIYHPL